MTEADALILVGDRDLALYFEEVAGLSGQPKLTANWMLGEFLRFLNEKEISVYESPVTTENFAELIGLIQSGKISGTMAKKVFIEVCKTLKSPSELVKEMGLEQITDEASIEILVRETLKAFPNQVLEYKGGKVKLIGFFVGQIMKRTKGQASPDIVNKLLKKILSE